ncbi:unnamed protein product [Paramecium sonneborni]|uniref:Uncharacterized protein n=1 Tax=Paramecium sonneborni TaxID=65129 RepID=A0A8S1R742_9CILI|nr:unnamed protein product [Paramecium sonneborni]
MHSLEISELLISKEEYQKKYSLFHITQLVLLDDKYILNSQINTIKKELLRLSYKIYLFYSPDILI